MLLINGVADFMVFSRLKPKSEFARNVLTLMTGTTIAQAIPIAISPILTRLYTPEDFGLQALFMSVVGISSTFVSGRYELAIMLPEKDEDAINLLAAGLIILILVVILLFGIVLIFNSEISSFLNNDSIRSWLYFIPLTVGFFGIFNLLSYFNNRKRYYKDIRNATIVKSISNSAIQLIVVFFKDGATGLISGRIISQLTANLKLSTNILKDKVLLRSINKITIKNVAIRYRKFPLFSVPTAFVNTLSLQSPILLFTKYFGTETVGYFSFANKIISLPMMLIGRSIGLVFFQESNNCKNDIPKLALLTKNTYRRLLNLGVIPFVFLAVFADKLFIFVFGRSWEISGEFAQLLSVWMLFLFIHSPVTTLFDTLEKQKQSLIFTLSLLIARVGIILFGVFFVESSLKTLAMYSIVGIVFNISILVYFFRILRIDIFKEVLYWVLLITPTVMIMYMLRFLLVLLGAL